MSIESAKAFLERVENDEDFRKESEEYTSVEERIKSVKAQGYDFTKEEIGTLAGEMSNTSGVNLCRGECCAWEQYWDK